ncbi:hypothetical protein [Furfurilactobacillus rossiae]|nr:hypothetical protein [Furfurilactobacillus rossiae]QFR65919.1 hypothetical protein LR814_01845 [Furfurilactobacillus rossiae]
MNIQKKSIATGLILMSLITFMTGDLSANAAKNSPANTTSKKTSYPKINIKDVPNGQFGGFSSGKWTEVAVTNRTHGKQIKWTRNSNKLKDKLTVTSNNIDDNHIALVNTRFSLENVRAKAKYEKGHGTMTVLPDPSENVKSSYSIKFFPKGTTAKLNFNNGFKDDKSKNRIALWTEKGNRTEYFAQN